MFSAHLVQFIWSVTSHLNLAKLSELAVSIRSEIPLLVDPTHHVYFFDGLRTIQYNM